MLCNKIHIHGQVYKTGFRYFLKAKADFAGVTGLVFYEDDKSVGVIASGTDENVDRFLQFCRAGYPPAQIENIQISEIPHQAFSSFDVVDEKPEVLGMHTD